MRNAPGSSMVEDRASGGPVLVPLSAASDAALAARARELAAWLGAGGHREGESGRAVSLDDVAYTLACERPHLGRRLAVVARDVEELASALAAYGAGEAHPALVAAQPGDSSGKIVFVFPGQGSQWVGMARELLGAEPVFRETLEACESVMRPYVDWSLMEQLRLDPTSPGYRLDTIDVIQPVLVSMEIAFAALWRSWGVEPAAVIGHSMGEMAAAHVAGALSLEDTMCTTCRFSQLLRRTSGQGTMAVVELSAEEAEAAIAGREDRLTIAVISSPRSTVIAGEPAALNALMAELERRDVFCRLIKVDIACHGPQMEPLLPDLRRALAGIRPRAGTLPIYSTTIEEVVDGSVMDGDYWAKNMRQPVLFSSMVQRLIAEGHFTFIEMSPHPVLLPAIEQCLRHAGRTGLTVASMRRGEPELAMLLAGLGKLYAAGHEVDWRRQHPEGGREVSLPEYPSQQEGYGEDAPPTSRGPREGGEAEVAARAAEESSIREALAAAEPGRQRRALLESYLRAQVASVLRLAAASVAVNRPFNALGMDSLKALELRNRLEAGLGVTLSATMFWNHPTVAHLAPFLAARMGIELEPLVVEGEPGSRERSLAAAGANSVSEELLTPIGDLEGAGVGSDLPQEELEALLDQELAAVEELLKGRKGG